MNCWRQTGAFERGAGCGVDLGTTSGTARKRLTSKSPIAVTTQFVRVFKDRAIAVPRSKCENGQTMTSFLHYAPVTAMKLSKTSF